MLEPSHRRAILVGDNTRNPQLELDVGDGAVEAGDRVLTTGVGGILPPDLPIGTTMNDGGTVRVALSATADASDFVQILDYGVPAQAPKLSAADVPSVQVSAANVVASEAPAKVASPRKPAQTVASASKEIPKPAQQGDR